MFPKKLFIKSSLICYLLSSQLQCYLVLPVSEPVRSLPCKPGVFTALPTASQGFGCGRSDESGIIHPSAFQLPYFIAVISSFVLSVLCLSVLLSIPCTVLLVVSLEGEKSEACVQTSRVRILSSIFYKFISFER